MLKIRKRRKIMIIAFLVCVLAIQCAIAIPSDAIQSASDGRIYTDSNSIPRRKVGLVLGCRRMMPSGRVNQYFRQRIRATAELFASSKIDYILVSGDNSRRDYDEPTDMKAALIELGIPESRIVCDYAGFTTLDSVVRAKKVFQEDTLIVISQEFHVRRAIYIGQSYGVDLIGYAAHDIVGVKSIRTRLREHFARLRAVLDVTILRRNPKFLGEAICIGPAPDAIQ